MLSSSCGGTTSASDVDIHQDTTPDTAEVADTTSDAAQPDTSLTIMTFNVLCSLCFDADHDPWAERLAYFADVFARHDADLIGLQEIIWRHEVDEIVDLLPGYQALFYPGDDDLLPYPDATVLYRAERFERVDSGNYWLSPTPDEPASTGFATSQLVRLVQWVHLRQRSDGRDLYFATMHVDNNTPSQELSAPLILARTAPWAEQMPVIVNGDFNSQTFDPAYLTLVQGVDGQGFAFDDTFDLAQEWDITHNQDPAPDYDAPGRIDHVFVAGGDWRCSRWTVDMSVYGARDTYPSDHWPVVAECELP
jgi:endonuclease/exonuclease/phosphatase family metal-dependent hydrolase